jgi:hypothetical protein
MLGDCALVKIASFKDLSEAKTHMEAIGSQNSHSYIVFSEHSGKVSEKSKKGYHYFDKSGTYRIDMTAEALKPCSFGRFSLTVKFDASDWKSLQVVSAKSGKGLSHWI